jgi:hypothetical protein
MVRSPRGNKGIRRLLQKKDGTESTVNRHGATVHSRDNRLRQQMENR